MNILVADLDTEWRGGQNQALLMLKGFVARGRTAELFTAEGSVLGRRAEAAGIPVHFASRGLFRLGAVRRLRRLLAQRRFDIVHANEPDAWNAAWLAGACRTASLLLSRRVGYPFRQPVLSAGRFRATERIVAISEWVVQQAVASGVPREKLSVVYEGVEIPAPQTEATRRAARARWLLRDDAAVIGCVGVLSPDKGQYRVIQAMPKLLGQFPNCRLLLAGDGPSRVEWENSARALGVADAVIFAGFVKDIETVYAALDVFVFPVQFEGLGTSLLAAMSHGVPSIAFDRCALGEIIEDGQSGILLREENTEALSGAIARVLSGHEMAQGLGQAGRQRIERKFSAHRMVEQMLRVYEQALAEHPAR